MTWQATTLTTPVNVSLLFAQTTSAVLSTMQAVGEAMHCLVSVRLAQKRASVFSP